MANVQGTTYLQGFAAGTGGNREDLIDLIVNVDPHDTPFLTTHPKTVARHVYHEWLTDALAGTSTTGAVEGASHEGVAQAVRARVANWTQIFRKDFDVTGSQRAVDPAAVTDEYAYQTGKALKEIARNIETTVFSAVTTATASTAARAMKTLVSFITTEAHHPEAAAIGGDGTSTASARIIEETQFNGMLDEIFQNGGNPDVVYVNSKGKRQISAFTTSTITSRNIAMADRRLVNSIDIYESDFGLIQITLDRFIPVGTSTATAATASNVDLGGRAFFLERGLCRLAFLRPIKHVPLPPGGDSARGMVLGELTLEVGNEKACGQMVGVVNAIANP